MPIFNKLFLMYFHNGPGMYYLEYTLKNPGESERHLVSVLGIANNGWYNRLYTLTGQVCDALLVTSLSVLRAIFSLKFEHYDFVFLAVPR